MLQHLEALDRQLFLFLNGHHVGFFDLVLFLASDQFFWIPFYLWLAVFLYRRLKMVAFYYYFWIVLLLVASDQLSSHLIKNWVRRPRPSHEPALAGLIHLSRAGPGGEYGFVSSHAANAFALTIFLALALPREYRPLKYVLFCCSLLVSYSRIYNGVHYPGDVIGGLLLGALLGLIFWRFSRYFLGTYLIAIRKRQGL